MLTPFAGREGMLEKGGGLTSAWWTFIGPEGMKETPATWLQLRFPHLSLALGLQPQLVTMSTCLSPAVPLGMGLTTTRTSRSSRRTRVVQAAVGKAARGLTSGQQHS